MSNLASRVIVAAIGIPVLLWAAHYGSWPLAAVVIAFQTAALVEWLRLHRAAGRHLFAPALILGVAGLDAMILLRSPELSPVIGLTVLAAILLLEMFRSRRTPLSNLGGTTLFLLYAAMPLALWLRLTAADAGERFAPSGALIVLFAATWACDSGAYFVGRALGRIKLFPAASPNKTVEGFVGGLLLSGAIVPLFGGLQWISPIGTDYAAIPLIVGVFGQGGDLLESLMKREVGVKDTAALLPGHGGILDRFDSMLISTPLLFAYLALTST